MLKDTTAILDIFVARVPPGRAVSLDRCRRRSAQAAARRRAAARGAAGRHASARRPARRSSRRSSACARWPRARAPATTPTSACSPTSCRAWRWTTRCPSRAPSRTSSTWPTSPSSITASAGAAPTCATRRAAPQRGSCADALRAAARRRHHARPPARGGERAAGRAGAHGASRPKSRAAASSRSTTALPRRWRMRDRPDLTAPEQDDLVADAPARDPGGVGHRATCAQQRPTPIDEVRSGLIVFEQSLWDALPRYVRSVDRALRRQHRPRAADRRGAAAVRLVDRRRPRRQPARHARRHAPRLPAVALGGGRALPARDRGAARRAVDRDAPPRSCARACPAATEPYRELLRERARAASTRRATWVEACAAGDGRARRPAPTSTWRPAICSRRLAPVPPLARGHRARPHRRRPAHRRAAARGGVRRHAGAPRHPAGLGAPHRGARRRSRRRSGSAPTPTGTKPARLAFLVRRAGRAARPLIPDDLDADAGGARRARHVPDDRRGAAGLARRLRHHHDPQRVGRAGRGAAAEGAAASRRRCASCRSSRPSRDLQQAGAVVDTLLGDAVVPRRASAAGRK